MARNRSEKLTPDQLALVDFALFIEAGEKDAPGTRDGRHDHFFDLAETSKDELRHMNPGRQYVDYMAYIFKTYGRHGTKQK